MLFHRASTSYYFRGIEFNFEDFITHLQYADDTLIFIPNNLSSLIHVKRILRWFELTSSLKINFYKSSLLGIKLDDDFTTGMTNGRCDSFPFRYLGLPLGDNLRRISTWKPVINFLDQSKAKFVERQDVKHDKQNLSSKIYLDCFIYLLYVHFPYAKGGDKNGHKTTKKVCVGWYIRLEETVKIVELNERVQSFRKRNEECRESS